MQSTTLHTCPEPRFRRDALVRLDGSPTMYRVHAVEGGAVQLAHMTGRLAGWWPRYLVSPAGEDAR